MFFELSRCFLINVDGDENVKEVGQPGCNHRTHGSVDGECGGNRHEKDV